MTKEYILMPEVPGELGENTLLDNSEHPPKVLALHFICKNWLGDDLIECFPVFLVSNRLRLALQNSDLKGCAFRESEQSIDHYVHEAFQPARPIPNFHWLMLEKKQSDFYIGANNNLVVSGKAFSLLQQFNIVYCDVSEMQ